MYIQRLEKLKWNKEDRKPSLGMLELMKEKKRDSKTEK